MTPAAATFTFLMALSTVALQIAVVVLFAVWFFSRRGNDTALSLFAERLALPAIFVLTLAGSAVTLMYSEVWGFVPCGLCWLQRIFLYPQVILAGLAMMKKQGAFIADYLIALSIFGVIIALYQHYIQMGGSKLAGCPTAGGDCAARFVFEFGYITFPLMAATLFSASMVLALFLRRGEKRISQI